MFIDFTPDISTDYYNRYCYKNFIPLRGEYRFDLTSNLYFIELATNSIVCDSRIGHLKSSDV